MTTPALAQQDAFDSQPFDMPTDDQVFNMRGAERTRKREERIQKSKMKVQDKTTFSSRMSRTTTGPVDRPATSRRDGAGDTAAAMLPQDHRRREKENMADFIAKKREIFLVQMSLDTKRSEIRKLEERALQREEALKRSEQMLEEDALRFDAFLKENDEKVQEAIKRAEVEAKSKQDKVHEIKRLNVQISQIKSELNKYEEQLEDCKKYKAFLDNLTPQEYFEEIEALKQQKIAMKKTEFQQAVDKVRGEKSGAAAAKAKAEDDLANASTQQEADAAEVALSQAQVRLQAAAKLEEPEPPESWEDPEEEDIDMYFKHPQQLLEIFSQLEEQNLFLIQNCQETEEALEELKNRYRETKQRMDAETETLRLQIKVLEADIGAEEEKGKNLREKMNEKMNGGQRMGVQDITLDSLSAKVNEVYVRCGFDSDASMSTLQMLTNIETKLEEYLTIIDEMPEDFVEAAEKAKEKERRQRAREEKIEQQKREQERRVRRALERAQAPVHKKTGKPLMFRSAPTRKKKVTETVQKNDEETQLEAFLAANF